MVVEKENYHHATPMANPNAVPRVDLGSRGPALREVRRSPAHLRSPAPPVLHVAGPRAPGVQTVPVCRPRLRRASFHRQSARGDEPDDAVVADRLGRVRLDGASAFRPALVRPPDSGRVARQLSGGDLRRCDRGLSRPVSNDGRGPASGSDADGPSLSRRGGSDPVHRRPAAGEGARDPVRGAGTTLAACLVRRSAVVERRTGSAAAVGTGTRLGRAVGLARAAVDQRQAGGVRLGDCPGVSGRAASVLREPLPAGPGQTRSGGRQPGQSGDAAEGAGAAEH